ncbi:MAG: thymidylate kinase, partial [bacterium]|nr:thymidylate kinase [bacterium]
MGKLIVIEGLDGSGKSTQLDILVNSLKQLRYNCTSVSFPDYNSNSSALVKMYLSGEFGQNPGDVNAYAS